MIGQRLASYEITAKLGEGGMGEVYRATDTRLKREVAIKVLPPAFTADEERLARFEREAQLLAQLHHPNIASIFGLEDANGVRGLVMELVEGPTLADRLKSGPLPLEESLSIARQIAEALEAAHEKGIVHRDLKPQNVKAAVEGKVKVLDFGLAKAMDPMSASGSASQLAQSPTMTLGATQFGVILGTAAYMAPEQAKGFAVDKRADIWACGVVLFEMLTGKSLFAGDSVPDTLARVLQRDIDFGALPANVPPSIRQLLRRCLERNPKNRIHDIGDARIVLEDALAGRADELPVSAVTIRGGQRAALWAGAALALGLTVGHLATRMSGSVSGGTSATSFERLTFRPGHFVNARFAPDGQTVLLAADWDSTEREVFQVRPKAGELAIGLRDVELLSVSRSGELAVRLPQVETGNPYVASGTLAVVSASGGTPRKLADGVFGADWAPDGKSLAVLRSAGGAWRLEYPLGTLLYESSQRFFWIRVSPSGEAVAFFEYEPDGRLAVAVVDRSGARQVWSGGWSDWWNLAWSPDGEEVWFGAARAGSAASLHAVDRRGRLRTLLTAPGALELHDVAADGTVLAAQVDVRSQAFGGRVGEAAERNLSWLEDSRVVDFSPDGKEVLLAVISEREPDLVAVYLRSMDGSSPVRLGSGSPQELSRDGRWALATRGGAIVALPTASGEERVVETGLATLSEAHWMPDGIHVLAVAREGGAASLRILSLGGGPARTVVERFDLPAAFSGYTRQFSPVSPDGRFVAGATATRGIVLLSLDGGEPRAITGGSASEKPIEWTADGRHLFVLDPSDLPGRIYRIEVASGRRTLWREILPADRVGVSGIENVTLTPDASAYAYSYRQFRSNLYLVKGLR